MFDKWTENWKRKFNENEIQFLVAKKCNLLATSKKLKKFHWTLGAFCKTTYNSIC